MLHSASGRPGQDLPIPSSRALCAQVRCTLHTSPAPSPQEPSKQNLVVKPTLKDLRCCLHASLLCCWPASRRGLWLLHRGLFLTEVQIGKWHAP